MTTKLEQAARQAQIAISDAVNALLFLARDCEMRNSAIDTGNAATAALQEAFDHSGEPTEKVEQDCVGAQHHRYAGSFGG